MQGLGAMLIMWGLADFFLGLNDIDIYMELFDFYVSDELWYWTPWIAVFVGSVLIRAGSSSK